MMSHFSDNTGIKLSWMWVFVLWKVSLPPLKKKKILKETVEGIVCGKKSYY